MSSAGRSVSEGRGWIPARFGLPFCALLAWMSISGIGQPALARSRAAGQIAFEKIVIDPEFRSEGVTVADVNRDGKLDIVAGNFWYEAPDWKAHEIAPARKFDPAKGYSNSFLDFTLDVNGDKWPDQIVFGFPGREAVLRLNPQGKADPWKEYLIAPNARTESPIFANLSGVATPVLVFPYDAASMAWVELNRDPSQGFVRHLISNNGAGAMKIPAHGLGVGDVNGDGRPDVIITSGYWEAPKDPRTTPWTFIPASLGPDCAQMIAYDVNGDGLNDVLASSAHKIGIWWYEQHKGSSGPEFVQHVIDESFSQSHALVLADINGDGLKDIVTGKRFWAHGPAGDVNPGDPCVLYWFELRRQGGKVEWIKHLIDSDSGVGTQFEVVDVNRDGLLDIVVANKKGVFLFLQHRTAAKGR